MKPDFQHVDEEDERRRIRSKQEPDRKGSMMGKVHRTEEEARAAEERQRFELAAMGSLNISDQGP